MIEQIKHTATPKETPLQKIKIDIAIQATRIALYPIAFIVMKGLILANDIFTIINERKNKK